MVQHWVDHLAAQGYDPAELRVQVVAPDGLTVILPVAGHAAGGPVLPPMGPGVSGEGLPPRDPLAPPDALWLSPLGERIVGFLAGRNGWATGDEIARALGDERASNQLRGVLHDLAERRILEAVQSKGYRLPVRTNEPTSADMKI